MRHLQQSLHPTRLYGREAQSRTPHMQMTVDHTLGFWNCRLCYGEARLDGDTRDWLVWRNGKSRPPS
jgi:hypothetical protein